MASDKNSKTEKLTITMSKEVKKCIINLAEHSKKYTQTEVGRILMCYGMVWANNHIKNPALVDYWLDAYVENIKLPNERNNPILELIGKLKLKGGEDL